MLLPRSLTRASGRRRQSRIEGRVNMAPSLTQRWTQQDRTARVSAWLFTLVLCFLTLSATRAADWPASPIHIILPFTPGASTDVVIRTIAPKFSELIGAPA